MRRITVGLWAAPLVVACAACGHVGYRDTAASVLGRVVVYRNGIAYFERRARPDSDTLTLRVPHDLVDDLLRSLRVVDQATGEPLPVSYPTADASEDGMVSMTVQMPPGASHDLVLSYITEAPAWKPSYRVVLQPDGSVRVQGWAIVDNTSGEDWEAVQLAVGSSSALSFRFDLRSVRTVHRQTLQTDERFAVAPPVGSSVAREAEQQERPPEQLAEFSDEELDSDAARGGEVRFDFEDALVEGDMVRPTGATTHGARRPAATPARGRGRAGGRIAEEDPATQPPRSPPTSNRFNREAPDDRTQRLDGLATQLNQSRANIVIQGYASSADDDPAAGSLARAHSLRNELIARGVAPAQLSVQANGIVEGREGGVELVARNAAGGESPAAGADALGVVEDPVGESHFESESAMTVEHGSSAMVSVLSAGTTGEVVYVYEPDAARGDARFAYRAVRFVNPTESTLEQGPVTMYSDRSFLGEGLTESIPPGASAIVPYALDRQVLVERSTEPSDSLAHIVRLERGAMMAEFAHGRTTKLVARNRLATPVVLYYRHRLPAGWSLVSGPSTQERVGDDYLFRIELATSERREIEIRQTTPITRTVDLRSEQARTMLRAFLDEDRVPTELREPLTEVLAMHEQMRRLAEQISVRRRQGDDLRERQDELHMQILSLEAVGSRGNEMLRHLRDRLTEISNRLQRTTIEVVDLQQELLMAQIGFEDHLADLRVDEPHDPASAQPSGG